ncbi:MAG: glycosyltransferase [Sphingobacteriales bacterium]|nr:MAG: glycosyltransferase [Sphingobacteriales bacterium]
MDFLNKKQDRKFDKFTVVYVGTIHEIRGLRKAVEAIQLVKYPDIELHIIGESRYPHLTELFNSSPRVTYRGRIPWENLSSELGLYHVGLALFQPVPAFTYYPGENVVKLFEYAGLGIPFIISNFEGLSKFVKTYGGGLTADPTNPAEIARTIEKLYEDQVLYNRLSQEGQELVRKEFHWEAQKQKLINVYKKLLRH